MALGARLVLIRGDALGNSYDLGECASLGRSRRNDIVLRRAEVSREHALVKRRSEGSYVLEDLGSSNGTYVNDRPVVVPVRLGNGDVIRIGTALLRFEAEHRVAARKAHDTSSDTQIRSMRAVPSVAVGRSAAMQEVFVLLERCAGSSIPVLLQGETGTGKELIARGIHLASDRSDAALLAVNCAALSESLLESELFGHKRGAFTGAHEDRRGLFEEANGGTVFLDEVAEMPLAMQAKLLRVLQQGEIIPVGQSRPRTVDVRIVSATNRELAAEVDAGRFRADLYYRLAAFPIRLPALRERREDIPLIADHALTRISREQRRRIRRIEPAALAALERCEWPGNVRELENELRRAAVLAGDDDTIRLGHLSAGLRTATHRQASERTRLAPATEPSDTAIAGADDAPSADDGVGDLRRARDEFEAHYVERALLENRGNVAKTARQLGLSRQMLLRKLKRIGLR